MKKIKFNCRNSASGYDENMNLKTELKRMEGYYFRVFDYHLAVHKYLHGWRVSELASGCGITRLELTRKKAMECFIDMQKQKYDGLDFFAALAQRVPDIIEKYGKANEIEEVI